MKIKTFCTFIDHFIVIALKPIEETSQQDIPPSSCFNYGFYKFPVILPDTGVVVPSGNAVQSGNVSGVTFPEGASQVNVAEPPNTSVVVSANGSEEPGASIVSVSEPNTASSVSVAEYPPGASVSVSVSEGAPTAASVVPYEPNSGTQVSVYPPVSTVPLLMGFDLPLNITFFEHLTPKTNKDKSEARFCIPEKGTVLLISSAFSSVCFPLAENPGEEKAQVNFPKNTNVYLMWQDDADIVKLNNNQVSAELYDMKKDLTSDSKLLNKKLFLYHCRFSENGNISLNKKTGSAPGVELKINSNNVQFKKYSKLNIIGPRIPRVDR